MDPRGFGFVKFRNAEDVDEAKHHLNHSLTGGRDIAIIFTAKNRKTPQEMHRTGGISGHHGGSSRRWSPPRSPRRRYRSYSRSPSPIRNGSSFEMWHVELITGLVVLISSCRYFLLQTWPDFAESSEAASQQLVRFTFLHVLSSLQPLDYLVVASLSGFSEELLFRGALLPLIGVDWKSALVIGIISVVLHLGNGLPYL